MKKNIIPQPPNPDDGQYKGQTLAYNRAMYQWATQVKGKLEQNSFANDKPLDQQFILGSYTVSTSISGTSSLGAVANTLASLIASMKRRGIVTSNDLTGGNN